MLILAARYTLVFWFSLISSSYSDFVLVRYMDRIDNDIYAIALCTLGCMQRVKHQNSLFQYCFNTCNENEEELLNKSPITLVKIQENLVMDLVCRDDQSLTFQIDSYSSFLTNKKDTEINDSGNSVKTIYVIKRHLSNDGENYVYMTDDNLFVLSDLKENSAYLVNAVAVHNNGTYSVIAKDQKFSTLQRGFIPGNVRDIQIKGFFTDEHNPLQLKANLIWKPSSDRTCHYNIIFYSPHSVDYDLTPIRNPHQLYNYTLENLTFSSEFEIGIRAKNPNNFSKESKLVWKKVVTPSCEAWYNNNFNICAPHVPEGLLVEQIYTLNNELSLNVSWNQPKYYPSYYILRILDLVPNGSFYSFNISEKISSILIQNITLHSLFEVHLTAYTPGGNKTVQRSYAVKILRFSDENLAVKLISLIFVSVFCITIFSLAAYIILQRVKFKPDEDQHKDLERKGRFDSKLTFGNSIKDDERLENFGQIHLKADVTLLINDSMEIVRNELQLFEILGEGAFGLVRRGIYENKKYGAREVAVKMLKDNPSVEDIQAFRREIEVMKSVDRHPNIVGIIGHCTRSYTEMMLLTEYCSLGNLLNFLREEWKYVNEIYLKSNCINNLDNWKSQAEQYLDNGNILGRCSNYNNFNCIHRNEHSSNNPDNNNSNTSESLFNFDGKILNKIKPQYKNFDIDRKTEPIHNLNDILGNNTNSAHTICPTTSCIGMLPTDSTTKRDSKQLELISALNDDTPSNNQSTVCNEFCINTCKTRENFIVGEPTLNIHYNSKKYKPFFRLNTKSTPNGKMEARNCDNKILSEVTNNCNALKMNWAEKRPLTVENKSYFLYKKEQTYYNKDPSHIKKLESWTTTATDCNHTVGKDAIKNGKCRAPLSAKDLLDIAKQVALGMEFLAKNKVVHRDLAARNVLVDHDRIIKIADFGLSRDIYHENIYKKTGNGKLPIKWLALESMTHQVYTTQSDVWSYGILLYEIVTLGGTPYPSIPASRLLQKLKSGYRMEKPHGCGEDFYNLMYSCWNINPMDRPNFTKIIEILNGMLKDTSQQQINHTMMSRSLENSHGLFSNDDSYMKPLYH